MREHQHEEKTARHLDRLLEALDSGVPSQVKKLINSLNGAEIGDLLESLPQNRRQIVWGLVKVDLDGDVLVEVNDEVRAGLIRDTAPDDLIQAMGELDWTILQIFLMTSRTRSSRKFCVRWTGRIASVLHRSCRTRRIRPVA